MRILVAIFLFSMLSYAQGDLSSASAGDSLPTNTGKSEALQANADPLVIRNATKIAEVKLTPNEFLDKFAVWKKASQVKGAAPTAVFSSFLMQQALAPGKPALVNENDVEVASFFIAYKISSDLNLKFKDVVTARRTANSLADALKMTAKKENKTDALSKMDSLVSATAVQLR